jgi:hypothetical protein
LPALDPEIKPGNAILLVSEKMKSRADTLENVLRMAEVMTERIALDDEHDFARLEDALLDIAAKREGERIALNVTGGTKLMALAAQSVATTAGWQVFYVDIDTDEVITLGKPAQRKKLSATLGLSHYLRSYGYKSEKEIGHAALSPQHHELLQTLVTQVGSLEQALGQLNWLAQEAEDRHRLDIKLSPQQMDSRGLDALSRQFEEAGVLHMQADTLNFCSESDRAFAKGGWLERYVFKTVCAVRKDIGIRDQAVNLVVVDDAGVKNELDVAFMSRNRLFVIECKTARMDNENSTKANDTLFKLSEVSRRVGGIGTRGLLASYRPLGNAEKRLAKALGIELVCGVDLARLDERLKCWVRF